jgi:hypothetical protein
VRSFLREWIISAAALSSGTVLSAVTLDRVRDVCRRR